MDTESNTPYILGLDIGIASVGAALLAEDHIIDLHVRTFDAAENGKDGKALNHTRREARSVRNRLKRRTNRLSSLRQLFKQVGLIESADPQAFVTSASPWTLRAEGLDRLLNEKEWAATLYHLIKHRGFQSTRKSEAATDEKAGKMLSGVSRNQQLLEEGNYRTAGELAAKHPLFSESKRNKGGTYVNTFSRPILEAELHLLFAQQHQHGNTHTSNEFKQQVYTLLMQRLPAITEQQMIKMLGQCTFEPQEYRAPKASYTAERFVWLTRLNNLRLTNFKEERQLTSDERQQVIDLPFTQAKLTYKQLREKLKLDDQWRFNEQRDKPDTATFHEAKAFHALRRVYEKSGLKDQWKRDSQDSQRIDRLAYALSIYKEDDKSAQWMREQGIEDEVIAAALNQSFTGFIRLSLKALHKILPFMEQDKRYDEAVQLAGYKHHSHLGVSGKGTSIKRFSKDLVKNTVVTRALNQARKVINAIIREHGMPSAIHIELARDIGRSFQERRDIESEQEKYRKYKEQDIKTFESNFGFTPKGSDLIQWRLYREQDGKCAYSLKPVDINRLFEDGYTEVDHALPRSRSFDNSMSNRVLVFTAENQNKGNQTPYEYLGGDEDSHRWRSFSAWVGSNPKFRARKKRTLLRKEFGGQASKEFRDRNLIDTSYIAKLLKQLIEQDLAMPSAGCVTVSGQMTGFLRARWGLIKVREDGDKHHALDAAVVAACSRSLVKRITDYSRKRELKYVQRNYVDAETGEIVNVAALRQLENKFPLPWPAFRDELIARLSDTPAHYLERLPHYTPEQAQQVQAIRVSRAPTRKDTGEAHQGTIRSAKHLDQQRSSVRTPLVDLRTQDLERIVGYEDPRNQVFIQALTQRLAAHDGNGKKAFETPFYKPTKNGEQGPSVKAVKLLTVHKSGIAVRDGVAANGSMVRTDIFSKDGQYFPVPIYASDAVKSELPNRAATRGKPEEQWDVMDDSYTFLFSLHHNDWVEVRLKGKLVEGYFAGLNRSNGIIKVWKHDRDKSCGGNGYSETGIKTALSFKKHHIDPLGRIYAARNESRKPLKRS